MFMWSDCPSAWVDRPSAWLPLGQGVTVAAGPVAGTVLAPTAWVKGGATIQVGSAAVVTAAPPGVVRIGATVQVGAALAHALAPAARIARGVSILAGAAVGMLLAPAATVRLAGVTIQADGLVLVAVAPACFAGVVRREWITGRDGQGSVWAASPLTRECGFASTVTREITGTSAVELMEFTEVTQ
ncbi:hypothetical protein G3N56_06255 [Desulfovibrio sulfodismutans]|uniref:Uncharacterized protein n=1 Tax=Desulfolutivibrio sulfodismutans TaxID=63561 RepID=A0A7K3NKQ9_9BACT|nr:hypothetical protein [Desulfolutivibrio sulfodismutans]NDY56345.1 hypothetical protein [Desulfolutivibrio sulfodismutans]QLA11534.1 hypothetical protein GD606_04200 [Desulfolutivibrio sulfodismutans DSM 3696]QLA14170.1 hypothetical protein GD606_18815 [Desulfolutivibrio sulfodismutans DSM 3696]